MDKDKCALLNYNDKNEIASILFENETKEKKNNLKGKYPNKTYICF